MLKISLRCHTKAFTIWGLGTGVYAVLLLKKDSAQNILVITPALGLQHVVILVIIALESLL